jgi:tetratricopeptide (TPR) repeat protein
MQQSGPAFMAEPLRCQLPYLPVLSFERSILCRGPPMASVFLSYDRDDAAKARPIALALEKAGHAVWWDLHVRGGAQFSKVIEEALKAADAVVVLWSAHSVESAWVRDEAAAGRDSGRLIPVALDGTEPPLGFRQFQTIDFSGWKGRGKPAQFAVLMDAVGALDRPGPLAQPETPPSAVGRGHGEKPGRLLIGGLMIALAAAAAVPLLVWQPWSGKAVVPIVAVAAAQNDASSGNLARDLLVRLGSLQTANSGSIRLTGQDRDRSAEAPDLLFQVASAADSKSTGATLVLMEKGRELLWSNDFEQLSGRSADLKQQIAFTAARVLECALEGRKGSGKRLKPEVLKLYLNACAQLAELSSVDPRPVIPMLREVIRSEPRFEAAWAKLLLAESVVARVAFTGGVPDRRAIAALRQHIQAARQRYPNMAEALIAESALVPAGDLAQFVAINERAGRQSPDNPAVLISLAGAMQRVGRMNDGIDYAQRAAQLDSLSPSTRSSYIGSLLYAGKIEAAQRELQNAERLWPGTKTLSDAQYRYHLRFGDPKVAREMAEVDQQGVGMRMFLETRSEPSRANVDRLVVYMDARISRMTDPISGLSFLVQALGEFGRNEELFEKLLAWKSPEDLAIISEVLFRPQLRRFRQDPRFMFIAKRARLTDYWRQSGNWPDFCFEVDQPYDCKKEAAKLAA